MGRIASGFSGLTKQYDEVSSAGDFIRYFLLPDDGDIAVFRIISEHEEEIAKEKELDTWLVRGVFHRHRATSQTGKTFFKATLCGKEEDENGILQGQCDFCDNDIRRSLMFLVWVYVYGIYHRRQNNQGMWEQAQLGQMTVYKEPVDKFMVWQGGFYDFQDLQSKLEMYGTLTDRDYRRIRRGARGDMQVSYAMEYMDPKSIREEILAQVGDLPDLAAIADGSITTMDGKVSDSSSTKDEGGGEASFAPPQYSEVPTNNNNPSTQELDDLPF